MLPLIPFNSSSGSNTGAIVGGIIGGIIALVALVLILLFFRRRRRYAKHQQVLKERPDLFTEGDAPQRQSSDFPQPVPYIVPTEASETGGTENAGGLFPPSRYSQSDHDRRTSNVSSSNSMSMGLPPLGTGFGGFGYHDQPGGPRSASPVTSTSGAGGSQWGGGTTTTAPSTSGMSRKSPMPPPLRTVNVIQHDDAGTVAGDDGEEADTVELPPAYTNIRRT